MRTCIGLDIGRSAVKVVATFGDANGHAQRVELSFPSSFAKAIRLTDPGAVARAEMDTVVVNGASYFTGETAITQGRDDMISGLTDDWIFGDQHAALLLSGVKRLGAMGVPHLDVALIAIGLPARLHDSQHKAYAASVAEIAPKAEIKVIPQSMGPYYAMLFDEQGMEQPGCDEKSWAIVEVGQYTTDFAMIERGAAAQRAFGSCDGMRIAAENLQKEVISRHSVSVTLVEATNMLIKAELKSFGERIDVTDDVKRAVEPLAEIIVNKAQQIFGTDLRTLDGIVLAGGGAALIRDAVASKWSKTASGKSIPPSFIQVPPRARFSVAEGFCRFARAVDVDRNGGVPAPVAATTVEKSIPVELGSVGSTTLKKTTVWPTPSVRSTVAAATEETGA